MLACFLHDWLKTSWGLRSMLNEDPNTARGSCGAAFISESMAMDRAVRLGARSLVSARPNPRRLRRAVGVRAEHRERVATYPARKTLTLKSLPRLTKLAAEPATSTLVVTLEKPCNHHGRTPPCTR